MDHKFRGEFTYQESDGTVKSGVTGVRSTRSDAAYQLDMDKRVIAQCGGKWLSGEVVTLTLRNIR